MVVGGGENKKRVTQCARAAVSTSRQIKDDANMLLLCLNSTAPLLTQEAVADAEAAPWGREAEAVLLPRSPRTRDQWVEVQRKNVTVNTGMFSSLAGKPAGGGT
jgi:hypothetical protein